MDFDSTQAVVRAQAVLAAFGAIVVTRLTLRDNAADPDVKHALQHDFWNFIVALFLLNWCFIFVVLLLLFTLVSPAVLSSSV